MWSSQEGKWSERLCFICPLFEVRGFHLFYLPPRNITSIFLAVYILTYGFQLLLFMGRHMSLCELLLQRYRYIVLSIIVSSSHLPHVFLYITIILTFILFCTIVLSSYIHFSLKFLFLLFINVFLLSTRIISFSFP